MITKKTKAFIITIVSIIGVAFGSFLSYATEFRDVLYTGGFSPTPAYVYCYSDFSNETLTAIHNACLAWNGVGAGNLVYRSTTPHNTTTFPYVNNRNEITKGYRGSEKYLMAANPTQKQGSALTEVDIDINISHSFGTASTSFDTRTSITHELGHLLGLGELDSGTNHVMYYRRGVGEEVHYPSPRDTSNIISIYGTN